MRKATFTSLPVAVLLFTLSAAVAFSQGVGQVIFLRYTALVNTANQIRNLVIDPSFPNSPNEITYQTSLNRGSVGDQYGQWILGFIVPTNSGWYRIAISSDDHSVMWLSTNESPANLQMICLTAGSSGVGNYNNAGHRLQQSSPIYLEAGRHYYFEAMHKEGTGGDGIRIGWQPLVPGGPTNVANSVPGIPGTFLKSAINPGPVSFYRPPANVTVEDGGTAVFEVQFDGDAPFDYEWVINGVGQGPQKTFVPRATLTLAGQTTADHGKTISVLATNQAGASTATSPNATLQVVNDTTPPLIAEAIMAATAPTTLYLAFSEPVAAADVIDAFGYSLQGAASVQSAVPSADGRSAVVTLDISAGTVTNLETLTMTLLHDQSPGANASSNVSVTIYVNEGTIRFHRYDSVGGGSLNNLLPNANYPYFPAVVEFKTEFESPDISPNLDNYGTRMQGYLRVGRAGWYRFAIAPDDQAALFVSRDDRPSNAVLVAGQPHSQGTRNYNQHPMTRSGALRLEAGQKYYVETLHGNGTGGDHIAVAMQYIDQIPSSSQSITTTNGFIRDASLPVSGLYLSPYHEAVSIDPAYPQDLAANECSPTQVLQNRFLSGSPLFNIQWYNAASDTAIADATNANLALSAPLTNGSYYCVIGNVVNIVTSRTAVVTVPAYTNGPSIASASAFEGSTTVGITFDRTVDPSTSGDPFNYEVLEVSTATPIATILTVTNAALAPAPLGNLGGGGTRYVLQLDTPVTQPFRVKVASVVDCNGRPLDPAGMEYVVIPWAAAMNIGLPPHPAPLQGTNFPISTGNVDVRVPGLDIWNNGDQFHFIYRQIAGDFDLKVHTPRLDRADPWSKSGLTARENLTPGSRMVYAVTADYTTAGNAQLAQGRRDAQDAAAASWPSEPRPGMPRPLSWVRLKRVGGTFTSYYSTNGLWWTQVSTYTAAWGGVESGPLYVGICTTSHNTNANTTAEYRHYGDTSYPGASINILQQPISVTTPQGTRALFNVVAELVNAPPNELGYQWQKWDGGSFTNIPGATTASLQTGFLTVASDNGSRYRVVLSIPGLSVTSAEAVLTVETDTVRPRLLYAINLDVNNVAAFFSEPMHLDSTDPFRWSIDGGALVGSGTINATNPTRIDLALNTANPLVPGTVYTLTAGTLTGNIIDLAGNPTDPNPATASFVAVTNFLAGWVNPQMAPIDTIKVLPTVNRLPFGALEQRGFDGRMVQITNVYPNDNATMELVLAGTFLVGPWPFQQPQGPNVAGLPTFVETNLINYNILTTSLTDHLQPDKPFPGIPNPAYPAGGPGNTNYFTMEALTYLKLNQGLYRLGVNSDDGFRVTPATNASDTANSLILGEFSGGRGVADSTFDIYVPAAGLYPVRLIWEQGSGGAGVEFWSYDLQTGAYTGINDDAGIWAYRPSGGGSGVARPTLRVSASGGTVSICFADPGCAGCTYTLQSSPNLASPITWTDVPVTPVISGGLVCFSVTANQDVRFYQVKITE